MATFLHADGKTSQYNLYGWTLSVDNTSGEIKVENDNKVILENSIAEFAIDGNKTSLADCKKHKVRISESTGPFGVQKTADITATDGNVKVSQLINFYPDKDFFTTELILSSKNNISTRYIAPVAITRPFKAFDTAGNYAVFVPYDNDAWVRYRLTAFGDTIPDSYEVTALVNADARDGLVLGSISHDTWKTGVSVTASAPCAIDTLRLFNGIASKLTRDIIAHGAVKGNTVKSSLMFVGRFGDWRDGMEAYADACSTIAPKIASRGNRPFGWNSWGKLQTKINYDKAVEVSDFINSNIQKNSFDNDGAVYIGLDAFWDFGFKPEQHKEFVKHCHENGQKAGIYFCPFTDWGKNPEAKFAEMPEYKYKDAYLYGDGKILQFDGAYALDPTHPAVKARIKRQLEQFIEWGYEYVKIDFMAHGAYEADSHFDPTVTTGVQSYSHGMKFIDEVADGKLWINLSIAPLFPANYAHSRRIGCDAWADINNTEYTLNALTYGWWLDRVYHYNDADHMVLEGVTEGENRARVTSSAITGVFLLGDDMSEGGLDATKDRIKKYAANPGITQMVRECKSFRPIELGHGERATDAFCYSTGDALYVAVFNFTDTPTAKSIAMSRLGLDAGKEYAATELWSGEDCGVKNNLSLEIPSRDVKVLKINLK